MTHLQSINISIIILTPNPPNPIFPRLPINIEVQVSIW